MQQISSLTLVLKPTSRSSDQQDKPPQQRSLQPNSLGPYLQGALMEHVDAAYAGMLHQLPFNPYSQYCSAGEGNTLVWRVNALTSEAAEHVLAPLQKLDAIEIRSAHTTYEILKSTQETTNLKVLLDGIYEPGETKVKVQFLTPTAFKSQGSYVFMPTVRLMLQNLLMHYGQVYESSKEGDEETIAFIDQHTRILAYSLQSRYFAHVAGSDKKIPAFVGTATLGLGGPATVSGLVRMLLKFGEYAGVGIKTSMGMGGFKCL